jgi:hypothetical protein
MAGWGGLVFVGAFRPTKTGGCFRREPADENSSFARILGLIAHWYKIYIREFGDMCWFSFPSIVRIGLKSKDGRM